MRYLSLTVLVLLAACGTAPVAVDGGGDGGIEVDAAIVVDAAPETDAAGDAGAAWRRCGECRPSCGDAGSVCIPEPGTVHDCSACVVACGSREPLGETVVCETEVPTCPAISEQALYCFRMD
jgi:hypothetical protein